MTRPEPPLADGAAVSAEGSGDALGRLSMESSTGSARSRDVEKASQERGDVILCAVIVALLAVMLQGAALWLGPLRDGGRAAAAADAREVEIAQSMAEHGDFVAPPADAVEAEIARLRYERRESSADPDAGPIPVMDRMPGGPSWLMLVERLGLPALSASIAQALLAAGAALLAFAAAYGLTGRAGRAALVGGVVALHPALWAAGVAPGGVVWTLALLLGAAALCLRGKAMTFQGAAASGGLVGAASLFTPIGLGPGIALGAGVAMVRRGWAGMGCGLTVAAVATAPVIGWSYYTTGDPMGAPTTTVGATQRLAEDRAGVSAQPWGHAAHAATEFALVESYLERNAGQTTYDAIDAVAAERAGRSAGLAGLAQAPWIEASQGAVRRLLGHQLDPMLLALGVEVGPPAAIDRWLCKPAAVAATPAPPPRPLGVMEQRGHALEMARADIALNPAASSPAWGPLLGLAESPKDRLALGWSGLNLLMLCAGGVGLGVLLARRRYGEALCLLAIAAAATLAAMRSPHPGANTPAVLVCGVLLAGVWAARGEAIRLRKPKPEFIEPTAAPLEAPSTFQRLGETPLVSANAVASAPVGQRPHPSLRTPAPMESAAAPHPTPRPAPAASPQAPSPTGPVAPVPFGPPAASAGAGSGPVTGNGARPPRVRGPEAPGRRPDPDIGPLGRLVAAMHAPEEAGPPDAVSRLAQAAGGEERASQQVDAPPPGPGAGGGRDAEPDTPAGWPSWLRGKRGGPESSGDSAGDAGPRRPI